MSQSNFYMGVGKYIQKEYALREIGAEAAKLGTLALVIGGDRALDAALPRIAKSMKEVRLPYSVSSFHGFCTWEQVRRYQAEAERLGADVIIGVGGGKAIDTAKAAAEYSGARLINVPTSAAQCACYANIVIMYEPDGSTCGYISLSRPIDLVMADTDILVRHSPVRLLAAGIGDSMAKRPEIEFTLRHDGESPSMLSSVSYQLALQTYQLYERFGAKACEDMKKGLITKEVDDIICANLVLTGIVSSLVNGEKQISVAHNTYNAMCGHFKEQQRDFVHGEMVSMALPVQMALNGAPEEEIERLAAYLHTLGIPVKPSEMGLEPSEEHLRYLVDYIAGHLPQFDEALKQQLLDSMRRWWR